MTDLLGSQGRRDRLADAQSTRPVERVLAGDAWGFGWGAASRNDDPPRRIADGPRHPAKGTNDITQKRGT